MTARFRPLFPVKNLRFRLSASYHILKPPLQAASAAGAAPLKRGLVSVLSLSW